LVYVGHVNHGLKVVILILR